MPKDAYPILYQINIRVWLTALSGPLGRKATLDDIPDKELERISKLGFDWIWLLSIWQTGPLSRSVAVRHPELQKEFADTLPDLKEEDIAGSGFAIAVYQIPEELGGDAALDRLRSRMKNFGLHLMLDFIPNHVGLDHPWVQSHPEYFVRGTLTDMDREPANYTSLQVGDQKMIFAHGKDPNFPGWQDTLQLNYGNKSLCEAMTRELSEVASKCDGVRCDMAMLLLPEVFNRTWNIPMDDFWPAAIRTVRELFPGFLMLAEVYWGLEWKLQKDGFDYTYDKALYDLLKEGQAHDVLSHFLARVNYQNRLARFLENHDEQRAAVAFPFDVHRSAAIITYLSPGLKFFHQGQLEGWKRRIPAHLARGPHEERDGRIVDFYNKLLEILRKKSLRSGKWKLLPCTAAWEGNHSNDCFICFSWEEGREKFVACVNYAYHQSQCYVKLPFADLKGKNWKLADLISGNSYERVGADLTTNGLYLDEPPWKGMVFELTAK